MSEQMVTYAEAINQALKEEMRRDERVILWGEDMSNRGPYTEFGLLFEEFGKDRVLDTPIVEVAIVEAAVGASLAGLKPIAEVMFGGLIPLCLDGIFLKLGSYYQEFNYKGPLPAVIFSAIALGVGLGQDHALSPEALLIHSPGLKVVMPSTAYDAKGLLKSAIRDGWPVVYMPHRILSFGDKQAIPTEEYLVPLGKADVKRTGKDVTIVTYSAMVRKALTAAEQLSKEGIDVEVVDLRCLVPLDIQTVVQSVNKTRRLLVAHEAMKRGGVAGEITLRFIEAAPELTKSLKSPIKRLAGKNVALARGVALERRLIPQTDDIVNAVKEML